MPFSGLSGGSTSLALLSPSRRNSFCGIVSSVKPQSMQTKSLGNTQTTGLSTFSSPRTWTLISAANFV
jgi:hypothetical protein